MSTLTTPITSDPITEPTPEPNPTPAPPPAPDPLATLKHELEQTRQSLATLTRDRHNARELFANGAIDLDISSAVVERELAANPNTEIPKLVADLKKRKPTLFRRPGGLDSLNLPTHTPHTSHAPKPAPTMSQRPTNSETPRDRAATEARTTNSRSSLLNYMRLRRQPAD